MLFLVPERGLHLDDVAPLVVVLKVLGLLFEQVLLHPDGNLLHDFKHLCKAPVHHGGSAVSGETKARGRVVDVHGAVFVQSPQNQHSGRREGHVEQFAGKQQNVHHGGVGVHHEVNVDVVVAAQLQHENIPSCDAVVVVLVHLAGLRILIHVVVPGGHAAGKNAGSGVQRNHVHQSILVLEVPPPPLVTAEVRLEADEELVRLHTPQLVPGHVHLGRHNAGSGKGGDHPQDAAVKVLSPAAGSVLVQHDVVKDGGDLVKVKDVVNASAHRIVEDGYDGKRIRGHGGN